MMELQPFLIVQNLHIQKSRIDKVLKLNGLKINVAGNSFRISIKTKRNAIIKLEYNIGVCILKNKILLFAPKFIAAKSIFLFIF